MVLRRGFHSDVVFTGMAQCYDHPPPRSDPSYGIPPMGTTILPSIDMGIFPLETHTHTAAPSFNSTDRVLPSPVGGALTEPALGASRSSLLRGDKE